MKAYAPHQNFIAPARQSAALSRLAAGLITLVFASIAFNSAIGQLLGLLPDAGQLRSEMMAGTTPRGVLIVLFSFGVTIAALWVPVRMIHQRGLRSLFGPTQLASQQFLRVFWPCLALIAVILLVPMPEQLQPQFNVSFRDWIVWVPLALGAILLQVTTEELMFRGYLQSQLAARFSHPLIWIALPSFLFGLLHYSPGLYGDAAWLIVVWSVGFGVIAADLTARSGTLGPAIALHFANNISAILIISMKDHWDALALLSTSYGPDETQAIYSVFLIEALVLFCLWLVARIALRR